MPQGGNGAFPEHRIAVPMNAPEAHLRSAAQPRQDSSGRWLRQAQFRSDAVASPSCAERNSGATLERRKVLSFDAHRTVGGIPATKEPR